MIYTKNVDEHQIAFTIKDRENFDPIFEGHIIILPDTPYAQEWLVRNSLVAMTREQAVVVYASDLADLQTMYDERTTEFIAERAAQRPEYKELP
jgi:hypothetical protein